MPTEKIEHGMIIHNSECGMSIPHMLSDMKSNSFIYIPHAEEDEYSWSSAPYRAALSRTTTRIRCDKEPRRRHFGWKIGSWLLLVNPATDVKRRYSCNKIHYSNTTLVPSLEISRTTSVVGKQLEDACCCGQCILHHICLHCPWDVALHTCCEKLITELHAVDRSCPLLWSLQDSWEVMMEIGRTGAPRARLAPRGRSCTSQCCRRVQYGQVNRAPRALTPRSRQHHLRGVAAAAPLTPPPAQLQSPALQNVIWNENIHAVWNTILSVSFLVTKLGWCVRNPQGFGRELSTLQRATTRFKTLTEPHLSASLKTSECRTCSRIHHT